MLYICGIFVIFVLSALSSILARLASYILKAIERFLISCFLLKIVESCANVNTIF